MIDYQVIVGTCLWHVLFGRQAIMRKISELYMPARPKAALACPYIFVDYQSDL